MPKIRHYCFLMTNIRQKVPKSCQPFLEGMVVTLFTEVCFLVQYLEFGGHSWPASYNGMVFAYMIRWFQE